MNAPEPKSCRVCGREITWRKRWARVWDEVTTCSERCRRNRRTLSTQGQALEDLILSLTRARHPGSVCPSEVARGCDPEGWRELMEPTREAARRLVARGLVAMTQGGRVVDPSTARGPIRLALVASTASFTKACNRGDDGR